MKNNEILDDLSGETFYTEEEQEAYDAGFTAGDKSASRFYFVLFMIVLAVILYQILRHEA
jgi:hypothetical protein